MTKLFDNMAALEFEKDDKGEVCSKNATSMFSKDGEEVTLAHICDCDGQVRKLELLQTHRILIWNQYDYF